MLPKDIYMLHWYFFEAIVFFFRTSVSLILSHFFFYDRGENFKNNVTEAAKSLAQ